MANASTVDKNRNKVVAAVTYTEQTAGQCPIASTMVGDWNDGGTMKRRNKDGSDTVLPTGDLTSGAYRCDAVVTTSLAAYVYANGTLGVGATLTGAGVGAFATQDGVTSVANNLYLVPASVVSDAKYAGYYKLTTLGSGAIIAVLTRAVPLDQSAEWRDGTAFVIKAGTLHADTLWRYTGADSPTIGTTAITLARDPLVVTTNTDQTISGAKTHSAALYADAGLDRSAAAALELGKTNANAVDVSKSGSLTTVKGGLQVDEASNLNGDVNLGNAATDTITPVGVVDADLVFVKEVTREIRVAASTTGATAGAALTVLSGNGNGAVGGNASLDTGTGTTGGAAQVGRSNAESVAVSRTGKTTTVYGPLVAAESVTTAASLDTSGAATLQLGQAAATKVEIADTAVTTEIQGPLAALEGVVITGDASVSGNLRVTGATVSTSSEAVRIADNYIDLNDGYTTAAAQAGGVTVNYLPTATADTVAAGGFTAAVVGVSNATVATAGAATFALADIILISGATNEANNGLFEVFSHAANVLTLRGVGLNATVEGFTLNQVTTSAGVGGALTKVNVSVARAGADGKWEQGRAAVTPIAFADFATAGIAPAGNVDAGGTGAVTGASASDGTGAVTGASASDGTGAVTGASASDGTGATAGTAATNVAEARSGFVRYEAPIAAELISISADAALAADGARTIAAQPDYPRGLQIRITIATNAITAGNLTVVGVGTSGEALSVVKSLITAVSATVDVAEAFATVTSATVAGLVGAGGAGDNLSIGVSTKLGLVGCKTPASAGFAVHKANLNNANEAVGTVDAALGTIIPTTVPNAANNYSVWYTYAVTPTQNSHTHAGPAHTHAAGTLAGPAHTHAAGTLAGPAHTHAAGTFAGPSHQHAVTGVTQQS